MNVNIFRLEIFIICWPVRSRCVMTHNIISWCCKNLENSEIQTPRQLPSQMRDKEVEVDGAWQSLSWRWEGSVWGSERQQFDYDISAITSCCCCLAVINSRPELGRDKAIVANTPLWRLSVEEWPGVRTIKKLCISVSWNSDSVTLLEQSSHNLIKDHLILGWTARKSVSRLIVGLTASVGDLVRWEVTPARFRDD